MTKKPNKVTFFDDYVEMELTQGYKTQIDKESYELVKGYRWHANITKSGYVAAKTWIKLANGKQTTILMSRLLLNAPEELLVDHKDLNPLNNRLDNIRLATRSENNRNVKGRSNSGTKNICFRETLGRFYWVVYVHLNGKQRTKSFRVSTDFSDKDVQFKAAEKYRDSFVIKFHGEFANLSH